MPGGRHKTSDIWEHPLSNSETVEQPSNSSRKVT